MAKNLMLIFVAFVLRKHIVLPESIHGLKLHRVGRSIDSRITRSFAYILPRRVIQDVASFRREAYAVQDCFRRRHGAGPCTPSSNLESVSQNWADHLASIGSLEHSRDRYGENLYAGSATITGKDPIITWYNEEQNYDYSNPGFSSRTGHFTQLVWKGSTRCGISFATGQSGLTFVVVNYDPPGNSGNYARNVGPPDGTQENCAAAGGRGRGGGSGGGGSSGGSVVNMGGGGNLPPSSRPPGSAPTSSRPPDSRPLSRNACYYSKNGDMYCLHSKIHEKGTNYIHTDYDYVAK